MFAVVYIKFVSDFIQPHNCNTNKIRLRSTSSTYHLMHAYVCYVIQAIKHLLVKLGIHELMCMTLVQSSVTPRSWTWSVMTVAYQHWYRNLSNRFALAYIYTQQKIFIHNPFTVNRILLSNTVLNSWTPFNYKNNQHTSYMTSLGESRLSK